MSKLVPRISIIGGGTGSFVILSELKALTPHLSALVNMSDDGGATGQLRAELGAMPPGDVRQCLTALSQDSEIAELFKYRFGEGQLTGQTVGNIILAGLEKTQGNFDQAVRAASRLLDIVGEVVPITLDNHELIMIDDSYVTRGEYNIAHQSFIGPDAVLELDPPADINPAAAAAIAQADLVTIAPGSFYGSILPALCVDGVREALESSMTKKAMIVNLQNKPGQTEGWHVVDYVEKLEKYIGQNSLDYVVYNTHLPSQAFLSKYSASGEQLVDCRPDRFTEISATAIGLDLLDETPVAQDKHDRAIRRTRIRHNGRVLSRLIMELAQTTG